MPEYKAASKLLLYYPIGKEPDLLTLASEDGKKAAFPVVRKGKMIFYNSENTESFRPGALGIPEPDANSCEPVADLAGSFCVVPALALDRRGIRIGYGGGYYDKFLRAYSGFSVCAVFPELFVEELPADRHDVPVNAAAVACRGVIRFN